MPDRLPFGFRTGYAYINEYGFPPNSVDAAEAAVFYDQECGVETTPSHTPCHFTQLPTLSCRDALKAKVGQVDTRVHFEHIPWDPAVANKLRLSTVTNPTGADIQCLPGDRIGVG